MRTIVFRFDVDTHVGAIEGVPRLLALADRLDVRFTFFVNMGRAVSQRHLLERLIARRSRDATAPKLSNWTKLGGAAFVRTVVKTGRALSLTGWTDSSDMVDMVPREMTEMVPRDTTVLAKLEQGGWLIAELLLRLAVNPRLRARLLRFLGADVGGNVRVYESRFFNLQNGFGNLHLADDVHIGTGSMLDLAGPLHLDRGVVVSPGTIVLTHSDPGAAHGSPLADRFPPSSEGVSIASYVWIGAGAVILDGVEVGDEAVIAAGAVVTGRVPAHQVWGGVPARRIDGE